VTLAAQEVAMSDLVALLTRLGFDEPRSLLQSGQSRFRTTEKQPFTRRLLDAEVLKRLGLERVFRSLEDEWKAVIAANPFPGEAKSDPDISSRCFCERVPEPENVKAAAGGIKGR